MPTYEYRCKKGHVFERLQKMNDAPLKRCDRCKGPVERLIGSGAGLIFKGSGFYITDYKKSSAAQKSDPRHAEGRQASPGGKPSAAPASKSSPTTKPK